MLSRREEKTTGRKVLRKTRESNYITSNNNNTAALLPPSWPTLTKHKPCPPLRKTPPYSIVFFLTEAAPLPLADARDSMRLRQRLRWPLTQSRPAMHWPVFNVAERWHTRLRKTQESMEWRRDVTADWWDERVFRVQKCWREMRPAITQRTGTARLTSWVETLALSEGGGAHLSCTMPR